MACGNFAHQHLGFRLVKFDHLAAFLINKMKMIMLARHFIPRTATAEIPPFKDPVLLEQANGAVDGGE